MVNRKITEGIRIPYKISGFWNSLKLTLSSNFDTDHSVYSRIKEFFFITDIPSFNQLKDFNAPDPENRYKKI
ncbi:hypothetical protein RIR_jg16629.t1 [Rhizophagus irregularis DAOM 181602=DAOM 197198]|nr:hypothetical protein RIR_jg16629.t1 [Rhizophagus irregularis DAOM 181602=DAOM 197198]